MSTYFIDFDGVMFKFGSNLLNKGAIEFIRRLKDEGHSVVFTTARKWIKNNDPKLNLYTTSKILKQNNIKYDQIVDNVSSPRILINDEGILSVNHNRDKQFSDDLILKIMNKDKIIKRTYDTLAAIAWIGNQYNWDDMDDYIQTILIGESLVANRGFNHRDLVRRYRTTPGHIIEENVLTPSGAHQHKIKHKVLGKAKVWKGQIWKLLKAFDLNYKAKAGDGITDGSAMKVACIAPFYLGDFESLVRNTDKITLVTHNTIEARCAALLILLRFRQIFLEAKVDNLYYLKNSLEEAVRILNIEKESQLFIKKLTQGIEITENIQEPSKLLKELSKVVGIAPLAISTPITACLFSSKIKDGYKKFTQASNYDEIKIDINNYIENGMPEYLDVLKNKGFGRKNILNMLKSKGFSKDHVLSKAVRVAHSAIRTPTTCFFASKIKNGYKKFTQTSNYDEIKIDINDYIENGMPEYLDVLRSKGFSKEQIHEIKYQNIDVDTFVSITFSLVAAQHGIKEIENDIASVEYKFTDNLKILAKNLVELSLL